MVPRSPPSLLVSRLIKLTSLTLSHGSLTFAHLWGYAFISVMVLFYYDQEDDFIFALETMVLTEPSAKWHVVLQSLILFWWVFWSCEYQVYKWTLKFGLSFHNQGKMEMFTVLLQCSFKIKTFSPIVKKLYFWNWNFKLNAKDQEKYHLGREQNIFKVLIKYSVLHIREYTFKEKQTTKKHNWVIVFLAS